MAVEARTVDGFASELAELRQSAERQRIILESTHDLVAELDAEGRVVFMSSSSREVLGLAPEELVGTNPLSLLHADDVEPPAAMFFERVSTRRPLGRGRLFRARHRDGSWRWLQGGGANYITEQGERRIVAVCRDVTEQLRIADEQLALEERLRRAQKDESLGMLAAGVAHDFNNLLTPILGAASLGLAELAEDAPLRSSLERIQRAAHQAAALTHQLLDYAGVGELDPESVDLSKAVLDMSGLLQSAVSRKIELAIELASDLPRVEADPAQLSQLVLDLVTNASDAIDAGPRDHGRVTLRTLRVEADRKALCELILGDELPAGDYVALEVGDDGCGIEQETRERIFDPFFTTKFSGRGLGLAAVLGIVRKHGGAIAVESAADRGSRFRVLLPARVAAAASVVETRSDIWQGRGTVLVADDDDGAREFLADTMQRAGFEVLVAGDGTEAIAAFHARSDDVRLLILDLIMPGAGIDEVVDSARALRAELPLLLVSGYSAEHPATKLASRRLAGFLQKPFLPETLLSEVRTLLQE